MSVDISTVLPTPLFARQLYLHSLSLEQARIGSIGRLRYDPELRLEMFIAEVLVISSKRIGAVRSEVFDTALIPGLFIIRC
jgi:hypothetical protein